MEVKLMEINTALIKYVQAQLRDDNTGHDFDHIKRVVALAQTIAMQIPSANLKIVMTAAYLHDVIDDKLVDDVDKQKASVHAILKKLEYTDAETNSIMNIITHMSYSANLVHQYVLSIDGQIVQDADRLDAIGAIGVARAMYFGGHFGDTIYDPAQMPRQNMDKSEYRQHTTVINHFYEKLFKLPNLMNTPVAKKIANRRQKFMQEFVNEFVDEWRGIH